MVRPVPHPGRLLERNGDVAPRGMTVHDRTRLTGRLRHFPRADDASNRLKAEVLSMKTYTAVMEKCPDTGLFVGYVPGFPGAHSQGKTLDELNENLQEVVSLLNS